MKNFLFILIILLTFYISYGQNEEYNVMVENNQKMLKKATLDFENGNFRESLDVLKDIEEFFEKTVEAQDIYYMIAKSYQKLKDIENSYKYLKKYELFFRYGKHNREINELIRYIEDIRERFSSIETNIKSIEELREKVNKLEKEKYYDLAIVNLKKIISIEPENAMNHHQLAVLYNKKEKVTSYNINLSYLKKELDEYLKITENIISPEVYYNIGTLYRKLEEIDIAKEYFKKVYDMSPDSTIGKVAYSYLN
ncbi:MAG: tetratricopeptide repeat protein [Candidatus Muirbacterium halophilum]|nr:tetratricopeptide repeat protein [Candidatus Muirbacterium halophilum]MCK9477026.1 tetratricopeptide repeat protein [Candidatus Muirbacterium halophilum]